MDYLQLDWDRICWESFNNIRCQSRKFLHLWVNSVSGWLFFFSTGSVLHEGPCHPAGSISSFSIPSYFCQASKTNFLQIIFNVIQPALFWLFNGILYRCPNSLIKRFRVYNWMLVISTAWSLVTSVLFLLLLQKKVKSPIFIIPTLFLHISCKATIQFYTSLMHHLDF